MGLETNEEIFLTDEMVKRIAAAMEAKKVSSKCPLCADGYFSLADGFFAPRIVRRVEDAAKVNLGGRTSYWPCVALYCKECGFTASFSLSGLGLHDLCHEKGEAK